MFKHKMYFTPQSKSFTASLPLYIGGGVEKFIYSYQTTVNVYLQ